MDVAAPSNIAAAAFAAVAAAAQSDGLAAQGHVCPTTGDTNVSHAVQASLGAMQAAWQQARRRCAARGAPSITIGPPVPKDVFFAKFLW